MALKNHLLDVNDILSEEMGKTLGTRLVFSLDEEQITTLSTDFSSKIYRPLYFFDQHEKKWL